MTKFSKIIDIIKKFLDFLNSLYSLKKDDNIKIKRQSVETEIKKTNDVIKKELDKIDKIPTPDRSDIINRMRSGKL